MNGRVGRRAVLGAGGAVLLGAGALFLGGRIWELLRHVRAFGTIETIARQLDLIE